MQAATLQHPRSGQPNWAAPANFQEFVPQQYDATDASSMMTYNDPFSLVSTVQGLASTHQQPPINPYAHDPNTLASASFYQNAGTFAQPVTNLAPMNHVLSNASNTGAISQLRAHGPSQRELALVPKDSPRFIHCRQVEGGSSPQG